MRMENDSRAGSRAHSQFSTLYSQFRSQGERGAVALLAMLILMAAALTITAGLSLRGLGNLQAVDVSHRGEETFVGADGCVNETLLRLRNDSAYRGVTMTIVVPCVTTVTDNGGGQRTIHSVGTQQNITRHVRAIAQLGTVVLSGRTVNTRSVTLWEETLE